MTDQRLPDLQESDNREADPAAVETAASAAQKTVYREDMTIMRDDMSVSASSTGQDSWRSGVTTAGVAGEADAPKVLKQRFVLEEQIGCGGMGSVFRAKDLRKVEARDTQPFVAVKVLNNDFRHHPEAFIALEREASKSQGLRHSNIVSIFDFDKDADLPFITMELLEGDELADLLRAFPNGLPEELAWKVIQGMVLGLGHAHEEGVVHADFKPGNIYVTDRQVAKVLDFGIARAMRMNQGGEDTDFDPARLAALTPAYASREMLNGDNPEPRDDLFSLGIVIYMVLTGHHPYGRVPANEAAREGLKPERIKSLSRRRWRMIERCLRLNRQERPADAQEIFDGLFGKPAWKSWSAVATAGLVAISLLLFGLQDTASINEVKEEVRQETLVDAQIERIAQLLSSPQFDASWERLLFSEIQTLRTLTSAAAVNSLVNNRVDTLYGEHIAGLDDLDEAFAQFNAGTRFSDLRAASAGLHERLLMRADHLLEVPLTSHWLAEVEQTLSYATKHFPKSTELVVARAELVAYANSEVGRLSLADQTLLAEQAWNTFAAETFDEEASGAVESQLQQAVVVAALRRNKATAKRVAVGLRQDMTSLLNVSCLRLDVGQLSARLQQAQQQHPDHMAELGRLVGSRVHECVARLGAIDPDRAMSLQNDAVLRLGGLTNFENKGIDPCSLHYLVGNGAQSGRGGFCADALFSDNQSEPDQGPRLVVVPAAESIPKFAISKYEISWHDLNNFCQGSSLCVTSPADGLPVTGLPIDVVEAYARWLSEKTGYRYRLPTANEWRQIAQGEPDPNRNCRIDIGGVLRGDAMLAAQSGAVNSLGLVHVLGNAQELVKGDDRYLALGGTFSDPIELCLADTRRNIEPGGDELTGFRLVREVS